MSSASGWIRALVARRPLFFVLSVFVVLLAAPGLGKLRLDVSNESLFLADDPNLLRYQALQESFGSDEVIYVLADVDDAFKEPTRSKLLALGERLRRLHFVSELRSPLHSPVAFNDEEGTIVSRSYSEELAAPTGGSAFDAKLWEQRVRGYSPFEGVFLSADARYVGYVLRIEPSYLTIKGRAEITDTLLALVHEGLWKDLQVEAVGTPMIITQRSGVLLREMGRVFLGGLAVIVIALLLLFRSLRAVLAPLALVAASLILTLGIMGWANVPLSTLSGILLTLILCVGVADAIHLISAYERQAASGLEPDEALVDALAEIHAPCLFTSLTSAAGFLALLSSLLAPVRHLGLFAALGCVVAYLLLLGLLPSLLAGWRPRARDQRAPAGEAALIWSAGLVSRRPRLIVGVTALAAIAILPGASRLFVNQDLLSNLSKEEPLRQQLEFVHERMGGTVSCEVLLVAKEPPADRTPKADMLLRAAAFEEWLAKAHPNIKSVIGISDGLRVMHGLMDGPREIPREDAQVAQLLLLLSSADARYMSQHVATDGASVRITARLNLTGSRETRRVLKEIERELEKRFEGVADAYVTGGAMLLSRTSEYIMATQKTSFALALLIVSLLIAGWTRELRLGLLSLAPNLLPIGLILGAVGWLGVAVTVTNALIATIAIGIIVDDTIHLTHALRTELYSGAPIDVAIERALRGAGRAVAVTSFVLGGCFLVYLSSSDRSIRIFGVLCAAVFLTAFAADVFLLPALVKLWPGTAQRKADDEEGPGVQDGIGEAPPAALPPPESGTAPPTLQEPSP